MADTTNISWTDATFNPWTGCTKVSPGCDSCYAEAWSKRAGAKVGKWGPGAPRVRTTPANWRKPLAWNSARFVQCPRCDWRGLFADTTHGGTCPRCDHDGGMSTVRMRVFCASLADVFDNEVPAGWRADLFELITATPNIDWLLLTKRIGNAEDMMREACLRVDAEANIPVPLPNVWLGATIVNQEEADRDIPKLLATPARVRFLSMEPLLGPVDLTAVRFEASAGYFGDALQWHHQPHCSRQERYPVVDWVITGAESGRNARPAHPAWFRSLRDQCAAAGTAFHHKQNGECLQATANADGTFEVEHEGFDHQSGPDRLRLGWVPEQEGRPGWYFARVGKKAAGRLLDGKTHDAFPEAAV